MSIFGEFQADGFHHALNIIPNKETLNLRNYLFDTYMQEHTHAVKNEALISNLFSEEEPFSAKDQAALNALKSELGPLALPTLHGTISTKARLADAILSLCQSEGVLEIAKDILDDERIFFHMAPAARIIHPLLRSALVPPHNDYSYNQHLKNDMDKYPFVTCWVPLQGKQNTNGGLKLYPKLESKEKGMQKEGSYWIDKWEVDLDEKYAFLPNYNIGDAIFFNPFLMHGSNEPKSGSKDFRISLDFRIFNSSTKSTKHYYCCTKKKVFEPGDGPCGA
jgi:hypothetical protein